MQSNPIVLLWDACVDAEALLKFALSAGVSTTVLLTAACAIARTALAYIPEGEVRPAVGLYLVEDWIEATRDGTPSVPTLAALTEMLHEVWSVADDADARPRGNGPAARAVADVLNVLTHDPLAWNFETLIYNASSAAGRAAANARYRNEWRSEYWKVADSATAKARRSFAAIVRQHINHWDLTPEGREWSATIRAKHRSGAA